jgi:hypothetical protein
MQAQPIGDPSTAERQHDAVVLDLLLVEHDGLWSVDELKRLVGDAVSVEDALARLTALGLVHRLEDFVFATRSAAHVHKLAS